MATKTFWLLIHPKGTHSAVYSLNYDIQTGSTWTLTCQPSENFQDSSRLHTLQLESWNHHFLHICRTTSSSTADTETSIRAAIHLHISGHVFRFWFSSMFCIWVRLWCGKAKEANLCWFWTPLKYRISLPFKSSEGKSTRQKHKAKAHIHIEEWQRSHSVTRVSRLLLNYEISCSVFSFSRLFLSEACCYILQWIFGCWDACQGTSMWKAQCVCTYACLCTMGRIYRTLLRFEEL